MLSTRFGTLDSIFSNHLIIIMGTALTAQNSITLCIILSSFVMNRFSYSIY